LMVQIGEYFDEHKPEVKVAGIPMKVIRKLMVLLDQVPDFRKQHMITYRLSDILLMAFLALLGGAEGYSEIVDFWNEQKRLYQKLYKQAALPSHDTFRRVISLLDGEMLNHLLVEIFFDSAMNLAAAVGIEPQQVRIISIDGKELRGSGRLYGTAKEVKNLQILNVYDQSTETCLFSIPIVQKTIEIPHVQAVLQTMQLKDTIVTADAMHAQQQTVHTIYQQGGEFLIGLKRNQITKHEIAEELFDQKTKERIRAAGKDFLSTVDRAHNQKEHRWYFLKRIPSWAAVDRNAARNVSMMKKMCLSLCKHMNSTSGVGCIRRTKKRFGWYFLDNLGAARNQTLLT